MQAFIYQQFEHTFSRIKLLILKLKYRDLIEIFCAVHFVNFVRRLRLYSMTAAQGTKDNRHKNQKHENIAVCYSGRSEKQASTWL